MTITDYINSGNSFPVILEDQGKKYFVKLRAGMSGQYGLVSEWLGNHLGNQLQIKTQSPHWIELDKDLKVENIHMEVKDLIHKSLGINIGFAYQEAAREIKKEEVATLNKQVANEIYLFDLMMINIDRTATNLNLMKVGDEIISVDYESSLLFQELIENKDLLNDPRILRCLRDNPLYEEIQEEVLDEFLKKLESLSIGEILAEIPLTLLSEAEHHLFNKGIAQRHKNKWFLKDTLSKLKNIKVETKEERKRRMKQNQENFNKRFKGNISRKPSK